MLYLLHYKLLPEKRLATLMADCKACISPPRERPDQLGLCLTLLGVADAIELVGAQVKQMDEKGFRIGGKTVAE